MWRTCSVIILLACISYLTIGTSPSPVFAADGDHAEASSETDMHGDHESHGDHGSHAAGSINPIPLDPDLAIVTAIIFVILLAVLWKFAWGPIVGALDNREETVANHLAEAKASQEKAQQLLTEHEAKLAGTAAEVKQMLDQARKDADQQKQQILDSAQAAANAEKDRALREIEAAKNSALQDLAQKSVDTAVDLAGNIVKRQLSADDHSNLIGEAMQKFENN